MTHLLFEKSYPKDLLEALRQIHTLDMSSNYSLAYFDSKVNEATLQRPVVFLFDYKAKGLEVTTEKLFESGFSVIAFKTTRQERLDFFDLSLTLIGLWPKILHVTKKEKSPFVFTYRYKSPKLSEYKKEKAV